MTEKLSTGIALITGMLKCAYQASGTLAEALADSEIKPEALARQFDSTCSLIENAAVNMRNICEHGRPNELINIAKTPLPDMSVAGRINVNNFGWLHIELNTLLPHCRFQSPVYITDTIVRLLDEYEKRHMPVRFDEALLVIDEHCDLSTRTVHDQDNKGWKAIPNALKGRVVRDDDQFVLELGLIRAKLRETSQTAIALSVLALNIAHIEGFTGH